MTGPARGPQPSAEVDTTRSREVQPEDAEEVESAGEDVDRLRGTSRPIDDSDGTNPRRDQGSDVDPSDPEE